MNKFTGRVVMCLETYEVADACEIEEEYMNESEDFDEYDEYVRRSGGYVSGYSVINGSSENIKG